MKDQHPASYRDPSGFIFSRNGILYRQVNKVYKEHFEHLISSGLYKSLVSKKWLLSHQNKESFTDTGINAFCILQPEPLSYISFPYEWSFNMLRDAARLTLDIALESMEYGMMLKDATPFNIQWHKGRMTFIDTLSFEIYNPASPWIAYRQFCETFLAPLALMHYHGWPLHQLQISYPEGIPLPLAGKWLPFRSKWNTHIFLHLHLHAKLTGKTAAQPTKPKPFSEKKLRNILLSLQLAVNGCKLDYKSTWAEYYNEAATRDNYLEEKKKIVTAWAKKLQPERALDLGANDGTFSRILAEHGIETIAADSDHFAVNKLYEGLKETKLPIYPVLQDFSNPSPALGLNHEAHASFASRSSSDLILALALVHHLSIGKNIPFHLLALQFSRMTKYLIIEFVPKSDEKVVKMLHQKPDIYEGYNEESFRRVFSERFHIMETKAVAQSGRTLYLMEKLNAE